MTPEKLEAIRAQHAAFMHVDVQVHLDRGDLLDEVDRLRAVEAERDALAARLAAIESGPALMTEMNAIEVYEGGERSRRPQLTHETWGNWFIPIGPSEHGRACYRIAKAAGGRSYAAGQRDERARVREVVTTIPDESLFEWNSTALLWGARNVRDKILAAIDPPAAEETSE